MKIKIRLRTDGLLRSLILSLLPTEAPQSGDSIAQLHGQVAALQVQRRSPCDFREWKPDIFYHLFVLVGAFWISWFTGAAWSSLRGILTTGICFWLLWFLLSGAYRLRLWLRCCWPNVLLNRKVALLQVEIERRRNRDRLTP